MKRYCLGFYFAQNCVLLIHKNRPDWQKGKVNGIGGSVEAGETAMCAILREFKEETGQETMGFQWKRVCTLVTEDRSEVFVFAAFGDRLFVPVQTDELCKWYPIKQMPDNIIPNLRWLVPVCLENAIHFEVQFYKAKP